jgi:hypothetical protein
MELAFLDGGELEDCSESGGVISEIHNPLYRFSNRFENLVAQKARDFL